MIQDMLKGNPLRGKNQTYKNAIVNIHRNSIESLNENFFIPFASITRIYLDNLGSTTTWNPKTILGAIIAFVGFLFFFTEEWWGIILGISAIIGGIVMVVNSLKNKNWYALNIEVASGAVYSFIADNKQPLDRGYKVLLETINELEEKRIVVNQIAFGENITQSM
jgi:hypothetical protein